MIAEQLSSFIIQQRPAEVPSHIRAAVKLRFLDLLGAGMAGWQLGLFRPVMQVMEWTAGPCLVWGEGCRVSARDAAVLNGFMAHCTYLEDGSRTTGGHPSSAVIPAVLALAEATEAAPDSFIMAVAVGYEVFLHIGANLYPASVQRGFQPTAVLASIGAAAGCASLLGLDSETCAHALCMAAPMGAGLKAALKEPSTQPLQVGRSGEGGLLAARMAAAGLKGHELNLEAFITAHGGDLKDGLADLGRDWKLEQTYMKVHAGCRGNHAAIDAALAVVRTHRLDLDQIQAIRIGIDKVTAAAEITHPQSAAEAQFSIPFSVAVALLHGDASLFQYSEKRFNDPAVRRVMDLVNVDVDPEMNQLLPASRGAKLEIVLRDGRRLRDKLFNARGEPETLLSAEEIADKFHLYAQEVLGDRARGVAARANALEDLTNMQELTDLLVAENRP